MSVYDMVLKVISTMCAISLLYSGCPLESLIDPMANFFKFYSDIGRSDIGFLTGALTSEWPYSKDPVLTIGILFGITFILWIACLKLRPFNEKIHSKV